MNNKAGSNEKLDKFVKLNLSLTDIENSKITNTHVSAAARHNSQKHERPVGSH